MAWGAGALSRPLPAVLFGFLREPCADSGRGVTGLHHFGKEPSSLDHGTPAHSSDGTPLGSSIWNIPLLLY
jgi:hypothetical protein